MAFNEAYGKLSNFLGMMFILANLVGGGVNFYFGSGGIADMWALKEKN